MRIRAYAQGLKELGVPVEVWAGYSSSFNRKKYNSVVTGEWKGIPFRVLSGTTRYINSVLWKAMVWFMANLRLLVLFGKHRNADIQWVAYMPEPSGLWWSIRFAQFFWNIPLNLIETELFSLVSNGKKQRFYQKLEALKRRVSDRILVLTPELEQAYRQYEGKAEILRITPLVAELGPLLSIHTHTPKTLGYFGTFGEKDGVDTMLSAFSAARRQMPDLTFVLSGRADVIPDTWPEGVSYTGPFPLNSLAERLQSCDTLILNRRDDAYSRHGFPIKLAEYTASGIPVLLCDFPFYREFFSDDEVWYFKPDSAADLSRAILARYSHPEKAQRMAQNARNICLQRFSPRATANELLEHLRT